MKLDHSIAQISATDLETELAVNAGPVSENRKRGRPKAWHADPVLDSLCSATTERGRANWRLLISAQRTLLAHWQPSFAWFWCLPPVDTADELTAKIMAGGVDLRSTVLTEIGRLTNDSDRIALARFICALPIDTTSREAVARARAWRGVDRRPPNADDLCEALRRALNEWLALRPTASRELVAEAIDVLRMAVRDIGNQTDSETVSEIDEAAE